MRYASAHQRLALYQAKPDKEVSGVKYQFEYGELIVGDPALDTAGNVIDTTDLMILFPNGANALEKVGLGRTFIEAPPVAITATPVDVPAGRLYKVLAGQVVNAGKVYLKGALFFVTTGSEACSGNGTIAYYPQPPIAELEADDMNTLAYPIKNVGNLQEVPPGWQYGQVIENDPKANVPTSGDYPQL